MTPRIWTPSAEDIVRAFHAVYGHVPEVRDPGLLQSAVDRPNVSAYGEEQYLFLADKAAALMDSISRSHSFVDGNKRCAWIAVRLMYFRNKGWVWVPGDDAAYDLVMRASSEHMSVAELAIELRNGFRGERTE